jgi:lysophospholipase L1-like esterase
MAQVPYTYLAIGDSVGFGITNGASYTQLSNGDRGYVSLYGNYLQTQNAGLRPTVVNASVFGDDSGSFFNTSNPARFLNTNYPSPPTAVSQRDRVLAEISTAAALGRPVTKVTVSMGANDLLSVVQQPGFLLLPPDQQGALVFGALNAMTSNLSTLYGTLRTALPTAEIVAVGYYDPFVVLPGNPNPALTANAIMTMNTIISDVSTFFGARYVDTYSAFSGHEAVLTNMLLDQTTSLPNVHPTDAGYAVIANQIIPTPGAGLVVATGVLVMARRRRAAA